MPLLPRDAHGKDTVLVQNTHEIFCLCLGVKVLLLDKSRKGCSFGGKLGKVEGRKNWGANGE